MRNLIIVSILLFLFASNSFSQNILGQWHGKANINGLSLRMVFNIKETDEGYSATMDSPDQNVKGIPVDSVSFNNSILKLSISAIKFSYTGVLKDDNTIEGSFSQGGFTFPLNLDREANLYNRPQEPKPPFPYISEDVKFRNEKENFALAGTLTIPNGEGKFPAVILITGSGSQNRDEEIMEHKPFLVISDYLTQKGIAVLRYDDRGFAESEGNMKNATTLNLSEDAKSAIDYLKTRKEIDQKHIGLIGHSEGGIIAVLLAANDENNGIAFIISMAGSGVSGDSILLKQNEILLKSSEMDDAIWESKTEQLREIYNISKSDIDEAIAKQELIKIFLSDIPSIARENEDLKNRLNDQASLFLSPWMRYFIGYDPTENLKKVKCPFLAINGNKDIQVDAETNISAIEKYATGSKKLTTKIYPDLNHLFQKCTTGMPYEYASIEETINPEVLEDMSNWILDIVK